MPAKAPPIVPPTRPKLTQPEAVKLVRLMGVEEPVAFLGVRGYYRDTMGAPGVNDRNIYDDALFIVSVTAFASFNANTDPSAFRKAIAVLDAGVWRYKPGKHKINSPTGYPAFVQAGPVTVTRDEVGKDTGWFGINIHRGGFNTTSSLGCQTIFPSQWDAFKALGYFELARHKMKDFAYVLVGEEKLRV